MAFTYDSETPLGEVRALIPDIVEADAIFDDATLNVYLKLGGHDPFKGAGLALGAAAIDHAKVESYTKTQGLTVDGSKAAALMMERSLWLVNYCADDDEDDLFDIAEMNVDDFSARQIAYNQSLRQGY